MIATFRASSLPLSGIALSFVGSPEGQENPDDADWQPPENWFGNIQYLINISIIGAFCCVFVFLVVKLRSDHQLPGPASLAAKLLAVWHATGQQVARLCGANASQYLVVEGYSFLSFLAVAFLALLLLLPLNLYGGTVALQDQFSRSTVIHIAKGSSLLWGHYFFMVTVVGIMHLCIQAVDKRLSSTRFHGEVSPDSISAFTLMVHGIPRTLAASKRPLQEYFEHRYPGKIFRVIVPPDLCTFCHLEQNLVRKRTQLSRLQAQSRSSFLTSEEPDFLMVYREDRNELVDFAGVGRNRFAVFRQGWHVCRSIVKQVWLRSLACGGCTEEDAITRLQLQCADLESKVLPYRDGRAPGAGIAFVIFKDLRTASRALQDIKSQSRRGMPSISEIELAQSRWKVERAPPARDIYWHHLGSSTLSRVIRRIAVNVFLLLLLFFFSSPLAALTALHNVGRLINPEAMDHVQVWLAWVQSSSWAAAVVLQFLPNVLIFCSMYLVIPAALSSLSSFESHLTLSGEQRAALVKTVLFFLVNLIFLRGLLETSLEAALLHVGRCYAEGAECKDIEQYMSSSFLANSCLSVTAFLITSTFLGISYDLLSPIPWIKRKIQQFKRQHVLDYGAGSPPLDYTIIAEESLQEELLPDGSFNFPGVEPRVVSTVGIDVNGEDLSVYPLARDVAWRTQAFDYAQYYAFNLTVFAMALIYSSFVPVIVPIASLYFGYRYAVDKYNFLFMYRVRGFPAINDGKLLGTVLRVMKICIVLYLFAMLYFFYVRGDREKLQFLCTLAVVVLVCMRYGIEKLISPSKDGFEVSVAENLGSVENFVNGSLDYEVLARPNFDWDTSAA